MKSVRTLIAGSLMVLTASLPLLSAPGGIITPLGGSVLLNGRPVLGGTAIQAGERIRVNPSAQARLVLPGAVVLAAGNSLFSLLPNARRLLRLDSGALRIEGAMSVQVRTRRIVPRAHAIYSVFRNQQTVYVQAIRGTVSLIGAGKPYSVAPGTMIRFDDQNATPSGAGSVTTHTLRNTVIIVSAAAAGIIGGLVTHSQSTANGNVVVSPSY